LLVLTRHAMCWPLFFEWCLQRLAMKNLKNLKNLMNLMNLMNITNEANIGVPMKQTCNINLTLGTTL
jgi:hypothetical protein